VVSGDARPAQQGEEVNTQDPELSAALGWPGGISDPALDRTRLLQMVAALRLASRQALEAICGAKLCEVNSMSSRYEMVRLMDEAITVLRAALAQQAEPVQVAERERERIASQWDGCVTRSLDTFGPVDIGASIRAGELVEAQQAEPVEPVGEVLHDWSTEKECIAGTWAHLNVLGKNLPVGTKLYTAPPQRTYLVKSAQEQEREECAQIADAEASIEGIAQRIAAAIRARGNT
jgi:hypothetical protein